MSQYKLPLVDGREILFESICAEEADRLYQTITTQKDNPEFEEYLFNLVTDGRYKEDLSSLDAGIILSVIYTAFGMSGVLIEVTEMPDLIEEARDSVNNSIYNILYTSILKAMPSYKFEELKDKSLKELLELFAISETVLGGQTVDVAKLRDILGIAQKKKGPSGKYKDREGKGKGMINTDQLKSLTQHLNDLEMGDFDEDGKYIGEGNML
jgi:hypothetical protein